MVATGIKDGKHSRGRPRRKIMEGIAQRPLRADTTEKILRSSND